MFYCISILRTYVWCGANATHQQLGRPTWVSTHLTGMRPPHALAWTEFRNSYSKIPTKLIPKYHLAQIVRKAKHQKCDTSLMCFLRSKLGFNYFPLFTVQRHLIGYSKNNVIQESYLFCLEIFQWIIIYVFVITRSFNYICEKCPTGYVFVGSQCYTSP